MRYDAVKLWIDDLRPMPEKFDVQAKTYDEAILWFTTGNIEFASFDHDLGEGKTGYDIAKWVEERVYMGRLPRFRWSVHSANPIGRARIIQALLNANKYWSHIEDNSTDA